MYTSFFRGFTKDLFQQVLLRNPEISSYIPTVANQTEDYSEYFTPVENCDVDGLFSFVNVLIPELKNKRVSYTNDLFQGQRLYKYSGFSNLPPNPTPRTIMGICEYDQFPKCLSMGICSNYTIDDFVRISNNVIPIRIYIVKNTDDLGGIEFFSNQIVEQLRSAGITNVVTTPFDFSYDAYEQLALEMSSTNPEDEIRFALYPNDDNDICEFISTQNQLYPITDVTFEFTRSFSIPLCSRNCKLLDALNKTLKELFDDGTLCRLRIENGACRDAALLWSPNDVCEPLMPVCIAKKSSEIHNTNKLLIPQNLI